MRRTEFYSDHTRHMHSTYSQLVIYTDEGDKVKSLEMMSEGDSIHVKKRKMKDEWLGMQHCFSFQIVHTRILLKWSSCECQQIGGRLGMTKMLIHARPVGLDYHGVEQLWSSNSSYRRIGKRE